MLAFADAHCHLNLFENPRQTISDAIKQGVQIMVCAGDSAKDSSECIDLCDGSHVFSVIGIGPDFAVSDSWFIDKLEELIRQNKGKIVGIGEIGLDTKLTGIDTHLQEEVFIKQVQVAQSLNVPVVIHSRGSLSRVVNLLHSTDIKKAMFHYFEGTDVEAMALASEGYLISIPSAINSRMKRVIKALDINNIVSETDSPIVGKSPFEVVKVVDEISKIKNIDKEVVARAITQNIRNLFSI